MYFERKIRSFNQRLIADGETWRKWWLGMSNEGCLPLFCMERDEDKLKAQAFFFTCMVNEGKETWMASNGGFSSNEISITFIVWVSRVVCWSGCVRTEWHYLCF